MGVKLYSLFGTIIFLLFPACKDETRQEQPREVPVTVISLCDSINTMEKFSATIQGRQDVDIYPQISGKLTQICVKEGEKVKSGQLLFVIDQVPFKAALRIAQANVHAAESQVATARLEESSKKSLYEGGVISEYELQMAHNDLLVAEANLEQAEAALIDAQNNLSYTEIKSPVNGVISTLPFRAGALVSPQITQPLTSVSDNEEMWVYFSISEKQLQSLIRRHGSKEDVVSSFPEVSLILSDGQPYGYKGKVETVSGMVNPQTGAVQVKSVFPNQDRLLFSGSIGNVIISNEQRDVIVIPKSTTYEIQDKTYAYLAKNGIAEAVEISVTPLEDGKRYIVNEGLNVGDTIVLEGVGSLREGQQIRTREAKR